MSTTTYTLQSSANGTFSWDTASNWAPSGIAYATGGGTTAADSLLFTNFNDAGGSYTATFGDTASASEYAYNITVDYSGATLEQNPTNVAQGAQTEIGFSGVFDLAAGTLNLSGGAQLYFTGPGTNEANIGDFIDDGTVVGDGVIDQSVTVITGSGVIESQADTGNDVNGMLIGAALAGTLTVQVDSSSVADIGSSVSSGVTVDLSGGTAGAINPTVAPSAGVELDDASQFSGTITGMTADTTASDAAAIANNNVSGLAGVTSYIDIAGQTGSGAYDAPTVTAVTYVANAGDPTSGGTIEVFDGATLEDSITVSGNYTGDSVAFVSDGGNNNNSDYGANVGTDIFFTDFPCFLPGTHILTPSGEIAVEALSAGDQVIAVVDGQRVARPVKWIGYRKLTLNARAMAAGLAPIRIRRGAMAQGLPARDLLVSPPHCMFIDGKLIPAKLLVNDMTIVREMTMTTVEYYHVELDRHSVLIAEGLETESYLDTGNRAFFSNAGLALLLHPEFHVNAGLRCWETDACAPLAVSPAAVQPVWRPLADRAIALGFVPPAHATTTEADIHLLADGRRIDSIAVNGSVHSFMVPAGVKSLALASRSVVPNVLVQYLDDPRQIGVAVRGITIRGMAEQVQFAADHPALAHGWHAPERADGAVWRWTKGHGTLPVGVVAGPVVVDVTVSETTTYLIDDAPAEGRLAA